MKLHFHYENGYWWVKEGIEKTFYIAYSNVSVFQAYADYCKRHCDMLPKYYRMLQNYRGPK